MRKTTPCYAPTASYGLLLTLISCLCIGPANAQEAAVARNGIKDHIEDLSWASLVTKPTSFGNAIDFTKNTAVRKLHDAPTQNCAEHLLDSLLVPEKTVISHLLLLSHDGLLAFDKWQSIDTVPIYRHCDSLVGWHYFYQDIYWTEYTNGEKIIPSEVLTYIAQRWQSVRSPHFSPHDFDGLEFHLAYLKRRLNTIAALRYPCEGSAENNSTDIEYNQLLNLFGQSQNSKVTGELITKLGEDFYIDTSYYNIYEEYTNEWTPQEVDTVVHYFEFNFPNDGLKLGFIDTRGLEVLTIYPTFRGELPLPFWPNTDQNTFEEKLTDWSYQKQGVYAKRTDQLEFTLYFRSEDKYVNDEYLNTQIDVSRLLIRDYHE